MNGISTAVLVVGVGFCSSAMGDTLSFAVGQPLGDLGSTSHTYTLDFVNVAATGFNGGDLFAKNFGLDEQGLGLARDPSGQHEIFIGSPTPFVQLNLTNLINRGFFDFQFEMNSTQGKDMWQVSACPTANTLCSNAQTLTGTNQLLQGAPVNLSAANPYLDFSMATGATSGNVLLAEITAAVPEPATLGLLGLGLAGVGFARRKRRG